MLIPLFNTLSQTDPHKNILDSIKDDQGVMVFGQIQGDKGNNLKMENEGLKAARPEPVEDDSQKIQGGNGQGKSGSHPLDEFLKGCEGSLF